MNTKESLSIMNIQTFVKLEKKGANYVACCPFHDEDSPSFVVSPEKNIFKCFGCGVSGDYVEFYRKRKNLSREEAYDELTGHVSKKAPKTPVENALNDLTKFYNFSLEKSAKGENAIKYMESRGFNKEDLDCFSIGISNGNTYKMLESMKYDALTISDTGCFNQKNNDIFYNRIVFPIIENRQTYGFTCRRIDNNDAQAKYLNTRETALFKKGELFFNFDNAINYINDKKSVIICEGTLDAMSYYVSGVKNVVATCGVSLTKMHLEKLKKHTNHIILAYDSDQAGVNAIIRSYKMAKEMSFEVSIILLNHVKDANDYMLKYGKDALKKVASKPITIFSYLFKKTKFNDSKEIFYQFLNMEDAITQKSIIKGLCSIDNQMFNFADVLKDFTLHTQRNEQYYFDCIVYQCLMNPNKINKMMYVVNQNILTNEQRNVLISIERRTFNEKVSNYIINCYDFNQLVCNFINEKLKSLR